MSISSFTLLLAMDALMSRYLRVLLFGLFVVSGAVSSRAEPLSERDMAARIDDHLTTTWAAGNVRPAPPASDAEFLRRAWLVVSWFGCCWCADLWNSGGEGVSVPGVCDASFKKQVLVTFADE